jgi:hypothetical protein
VPNEPKKGHYNLWHNKQELHKSTKKKPNSDCHHQFLSRTYMPYAARYSPAIKPTSLCNKDTETAILSTTLKISI